MRDHLASAVVTAATNDINSVGVSSTKQAYGVIRSASFTRQNEASMYPQHQCMSEKTGQPVKKPRVDLGPPSSTEMDEETSAYSLNDVQVVDDPTPFTTVSYRKNRSTGIPVVFKPVVTGSSFWRVNPNRIAQEILAAAQEKVQSHKISKDGSLIVTVASLESANKLLSLSNVATVDVTTSVPQSYSKNMGKINDVPLEYTDAELLDYLKDAGVMSVRRQVSFAPQSNGNIQATYREGVILQFRDDCPMPQRVVLGFTSHPVEEYFGSAKRCYRCQRHGHIAKNCRGPQRCKVCSAPHDYKECTSRRDPKCANCGGAHAASYFGCPRRRAATALHKHEILHGRVPQRRLPPPNPDAVRPASVFIPPRRASHEGDPVKSNSASQRSHSHQRPHGVRLPSSGKTVDLTLQTAPPPSAVPPSTSRGNDSAPAAMASTTPMVANQVFQGVSLDQVLLPMLFSALRAILQVFPQANDIPEVRAFLSMESLVQRPCVPVSELLTHG